MKDGMKILLISMPDRIYDMHWAARLPNLGLMSLAGNISDHQVRIMDLISMPNIWTILKREVRKIVSSFNPSIIGLSAMTFQCKSALRLASVIKQIDPNVKIVLGGYHATLAYCEIANDENAGSIDFIIRGEGEKTFEELVQALNEGDENSINSIAGLSYRKDGCFRHNDPRKLTDLSEMRLPDRTIRIFSNFHILGIPADVVETSRGCTMKCKYCCITGMYGRRYRIYPIERVLSDISNAKRAGARYIFFSDDNISLNLDRFDELLDAIIRSGHNDIKYATQVSCEGIASNEAIVAKMKRAGFDLVFIGAENIVEENLEYLGKRGDTGSTEKAIRFLDKYGIITIVGVMAGAPNDTPEKIRANISFLKKMKCYAYHRFVLTPHLGTQIRDELSQQELITNMDDYSRYEGFSVNIRTKHLSRRRLEWTIRWEQIRAFPYGIFISRNLILRRYPRYFLFHIWIAILAFVRDSVRCILARNS